MNVHRPFSANGSTERVRQRPAPTVMVTGSSGFVGQRVIRLFSARNISTIATYYHRLPEALAQVFPVCSDMASPELLLAPLRNVQTVVHLAWDNGLAGSLRQNQEEGDIKDLLLPERMSKNLAMVSNLLAAMERVGNQRIVFVSAMGAERHAKSPFLREKYAAELLILNSKIREKIIIRPSIVTEAENNDDRFMRAILRTMKMPLMYPVPKWPVPLRPIHVGDLAAEIVAAAEAPLDEGTVVTEACGSESYAVEDLFKIMADKFYAGQKLALTGWLGNCLTPIFEREGKNELRYKHHRLRHFLALAKVPHDSLIEAGKITHPDTRKTSFLESLKASLPLQKKQMTTATSTI